MEFEHLNQPDYDRERDGALEKIRDNYMFKGGNMMQRSYNEGFKAGLKFICDGYYVMNVTPDALGKMLEEVDKIDGEV